MTAAVGSEVVLDASASSDPDGDSLTYAWAFETKPNASSATLDAPESPITTFVLDEPGTYELRVTVSDGNHEADDTVKVHANRPPVADAGADLKGDVGAMLQLDGSASSDPDGDSLTYRWSLVSVPEQSTADIVDAESVEATFTPDKSGLYLLELLVTDGIAEGTASLNLEAVPAGSTGSSTLYLAPGGDDANPGTRDAPLATLREGVKRAGNNNTISRLELAPGTYDQGEDEYAISDDLEIIRPQDGAKPVIAGTANLLSIRESAFVALLRIELRTDGRAVEVGDEASVSITRVDCRASRCVTTGKFLGDAGGRVTVQNSTLTGAGSAMQGILAINTDEITVTESTISGFSGTGQGINLLASSATIRDTIIRDGEIGIELLGNTSEHPVMIRDSQLSGNEIGLKTSNSKNLTLRQTTIDTSSETGIYARGGATNLDSVTVRNGGGDGILIEDLSGGAVITVRQSTIQSHVGAGILVEGRRTTLDLGNETTAAGNDIRFNKVASLHDARPDDGTGLITLRDTRLDTRSLAPGTYKGPNFEQWKLRIDNKNEVTVY